MLLRLWTLPVASVASKLMRMAFRHEVAGSAEPLANLARARNCAALPGALLRVLSLGRVSGTCYFEPNICSSEPWWEFRPCRGSKMSNEQELASIPTAQGGLSRLAVARLESAGVPVAPLLGRVGLTPELIADPEERLSVPSQIALRDEAAIALKDDYLGFTLACDFDPRAAGLLYYVMASSQTLGDALKRIARYSQITNEALVVGYREE